MQGAGVQGHPLDTRLVIISPDINAARLTAALKACERGPIGTPERHPTLRAGHGAAAAAVRKLIAADATLLQLLPKSHGFEDTTLDGITDVTAAGSADAADSGEVVLGFIETDSMRLNGVYARDLNLELVALLNSLRPPFLACPVAPTGHP
ncbi:hypothetical protein T484DRAFT_1899626, partial [Baffinella frigidus]